MHVLPCLLCHRPGASGELLFVQCAFIWWEPAAPAGKYTQPGDKDPAQGCGVWPPRATSGFTLPALTLHIGQLWTRTGTSVPLEHHQGRREVGMQPWSRGMLSSTAKTHRSLARPATFGCCNGTQCLPLTQTSPAGMGRGPALRNSLMDLPGIVSTRKNPLEKRWRRGPLTPGAAPLFDVGPGLGGLATLAPRCHPQVNKAQHNCLLVY